jgi:hypothetical protein
MPFLRSVDLDMPGIAAAVSCREGLTKLSPC